VLKPVAATNLVSVRVCLASLFGLEHNSMLDHAGGSEIYTDVVDGLRYWMQGCPSLYGTACPGSVPVSNGRLSIELF